jgi:hypothetical protein
MAVSMDAMTVDLLAVSLVDLMVVMKDVLMGKLMVAWLV